MPRSDSHGVAAWQATNPERIEANPRQAVRERIDIDIADVTGLTHLGRHTCLC